jgi:DNA-binding GntR family transcriptional regulator
MAAKGATTSERIYAAVKRSILSSAFLPGQRIDASELANANSASVTPVRAALSRLLGERLIDAHPNDGFRMLQISEPWLRDLYAWNAQLLLASLAPPAVALRRSPATQTVALEDPNTADLATATAILFRQIASLSGNSEAIGAIASLNDRLLVARAFEPQLLNQGREELDILATAITVLDRHDLRALIVAYHRRRLYLATDLIRLMHHLPLAE